KQGTFEANAMRGLYVKAIEFQYDQFIKNNSELQGSNPKITIRYPRCAALAREMKDIFEHFGKVAKNVVAQDPSACSSTLSNMDFTKPNAKCGTNNDGSTPEMQACYLKGAALYVGGVSGSGMMDLLTCEFEEEAKAHYQAA